MNISDFSRTIYLIEDLKNITRKAKLCNDPKFKFDSELIWKDVKETLLQLEITGLEKFTGAFQRHINDFNDDNDDNDEELLRIKLLEIIENCHQFLQNQFKILLISQKDKEFTKSWQDKEMHILIVEDEEAIKDLLVETINDLFQTTTIEIATNGQEALGKCQESKFDLIITDNIMPTLSGSELVYRLRTNKDNKYAINTETPVLMISAYQPSIIGKFDNLLFLEKPYEERMLKVYILTSLTPFKDL
ncbi:MAG: response regulator [Halobacteriovoraceae bacterium]|nr:response regulator [Halobacteriovoraceae bacterium]MCB9095533.1 response regulator [Halobacteriovoraceae bacterium]